MTFSPGDIVRIGAGFVDWEVIGPARDAGFILLKSGMSGRHTRVRERHLKVWSERLARS